MPKPETSRKNLLKARARMEQLVKKAKQLEAREKEKEVENEVNKKEKEKDIIVEPDVYENDSGSEITDSDSDLTADTDSESEVEEAPVVVKKRGNSKQNKAKMTLKPIAQKVVKMAEQPVQSSQPSQEMIQKLIQDEFRKLNMDLSKSVVGHQTNLARNRALQFLRTNN